MTRRAVLTVALLCLAVLAFAVAPWTVPPGAIPGAIAKQLRDAYGFELKVDGRHTIALLPVPRLKFEDISIGTADGVALVQGGQLRGEFRVMPLLFGRMELSEISLNASRVSVRIDTAGRSTLDGVIERLKQQAQGASRSGHVRRLVMTGVQVAVHDDRTGSDVAVQDVDMVANWPGPDSSVSVAGGAVWRQERFDLTLDGVDAASLAAGRASRFTAALSAAAGRLSLVGEIWAAEGKAAGRALLEAGSVRDLMRWTGVGLPLGPLLPRLTAQGEFTADRSGVSSPAIGLTLGTDQLDGALALRIEGGRPTITGTLAADRLDLTPFFAPFAQAWQPDGSWTGEPFDLAGVTGGNLDLRLSATTARIGALRLDDLGASVLVKPGRIEASLGRATAHQGVVKGRLSLAAAGPRTDVRLLGSFDSLDVGGLLGSLGQPRWITGTGQGQVALEGVGESPADLLRQTNGRVAIGIKPGELMGVGLGDMLKRVERRPLSASLDWRGGRTAFDQALLTLNVVAGVGDVVEGSLASPLARASLQGRLSLVDGLVAMRAKVVGAGPAPSVTTTSQAASPAGMMFDITGPWDDVAVAPDARALIQRSGAAQPLLRQEGRDTAPGEEPEGPAGHQP